MAATTSADAHEERGAQKAEQKSWVEQWSDADKRLLLITFAGGLAANIGLVVVVALGILAAPVDRWFIHLSEVDEGKSFIIVAVVVAYIVCMLIPSLFAKTLFSRVLLFVATLAPLIVFGLGLVGMAAGVK